MASPKFSIGDVVFAKVKGYAAWPAKIEYFENSQSSNKVKYSVYFYGTNQIASCKEDELFSYTENKLKFGKPKKLKGFMKAISQADSELKLTRKSAADFTITLEEPEQISNLTHLDTLKAELKVLKIDLNIQNSLNQHTPNLDTCLQLLDEYSQVAIYPLIYKKNPELIDTLLKLQVYFQNVSLGNRHTVESETHNEHIESKILLIRKKARSIYLRVQTIFMIQQENSFLELYANHLIEFQRHIENMSASELLQLSKDPTI